MFQDIPKELYYHPHANYKHPRVIISNYLLNEHNYFNFLDYINGKKFLYMLFYNKRARFYR